MSFPRALAPPAVAVPVFVSLALGFWVEVEVLLPLEAVPVCAEEPMGVPVREGTDGLVLLLMEEVVVLDPPTRILGDGGAVVAVVLLLLLLLVVLVVVTVEGGARKMSPLLKFCSALVVDEKGPRTGMTEEEACCTTWEISFSEEESGDGESGLGGKWRRHACWGVGVDVTVLLTV